MSRFRFHIFPRLCLALSALVLLGGLWVLWLSMGWPMPTQGLAYRQVKTVRLLPHGTTSISGPFRYRNSVQSGKADAWVVRRTGDSFTLMELRRITGLLWRSETIMDIISSRWGEVIWTFPAGLDYYDVFQKGSLDSKTWSELTPVTVSDDSRVAQVGVTAVWVGGEERDAPATALAERGVAAWPLPAGGGAQSGPPLFMRFYSPGTVPRNFILLLSCRGYDADGELVAFYGQPLLSTAYFFNIWYAIPRGGYAMRQLIPASLLLALLFPATAATQSPITRAQFMATLWTRSGAAPYDANGPFSDVNPDSPGAMTVTWTCDLGIVWDTGGTLFVPDRSITREEAAVLLRRYIAYLGRDTFLPSGVAVCNNFERVSPWADDPLYWAAGIDLLTRGADGRSEPQDTLSPEELEQAPTRFFDCLVPAVPYLLEH